MRKLTTLYVNFPKTDERRICWKISGANGTQVKLKWYEHQPEVVTEKDSSKVLVISLYRQTIL